MREYLITEELDNLRSGWITRREFFRRAAILGVGAAAAASMAQSVTPVKIARAQNANQGSPLHIDADDPSVETETLWYHSMDGTPIYAYEAWPAGAQMDHSWPGVVVIHQNRGLNEHIMDVARRFAVQGYVAIAPDLVSRSGVTAVSLSPDEQLAAYSALDHSLLAPDALAALDTLKAHPSVDANKLAATGYCAGGGVTWELATLSPDLKAVAPFYGANPSLDAVPNIRAAVLAVYGALDQRIDAGIPAIEAAMKSAGITYQINVYPDSAHAFHDDTGQAYNPETARQAYTDTLNWFAQYLDLDPPRL